MDRYLDIVLLADPEFSAAQLLNALFAKLHRALVQHADGDIGISFPKLTEQPQARLGNVLRLHGSAASLEQLMELDWLTGMRDHCRLGVLQAVPADAQHRQVSRVQVQSSAERLRRRAIKRHGLNETEARQRIPDQAATRLDLPYLTLRSSSSSQTFRLFIQHGPLQAQASSGGFTSYGLSSQATIPWF